MKKITTALLIGILVAGGQQPKPAQQPPPAAQAGAEGTIKFTSSSQLVVEIVNVKDKSGKTIEGLKAEDFVVTENGAPQSIRFCEFQHLQDAVDMSANTVDSNSVTPDVVRPATVTPVTKNQIQPEAPGDIRYRDRRLLAVYFDMTAMPPQDQLRALTYARKFIRKQMAPADLLAIMPFQT